MLNFLTYLLIVMILVAAAAVYLDQRNFIFGSLLAFSLIVGVILLYLRILGYVLDQQIPILNIVVLLLPVIGLIVVVFWLIRNTRIISHKEGKSFTAKLSLFLAVSLVFDTYLIFLVGQIKTPWIDFFYTLAVMVYNTYLLLFFSYLIYSLFYQSIKVQKGADYIVVLGSYVHNGQVTPLLQSRVDKALAYYQSAEKKPKFVVSGGQGSDESISEAGAMKNYLLSVGVPESDIIVEDKSRNTFENFMFSKEKILEDWSKKETTTKPVILFSTSNYHVMRASLYSKRVGIQARGIGAPTSFYFLPTALIREYVAILSYYRLITFLLFLLEAIAAYVFVF